MHFVIKKHRKIKGGSYYTMHLYEGSFNLRLLGRATSARQAKAKIEKIYCKKFPQADRIEYR